MAQGGSSDDEMDILSKQLEGVHLDVMDQDDNYVYVLFVMANLQ